MLKWILNKVDKRFGEIVLLVIVAILASVLTRTFWSAQPVSESNLKLAALDPCFKQKLIERDQKLGPLKNSEIRHLQHECDEELTLMNQKKVVSQD